MSRVYLAGPITGLTYDAADDWRIYAKEQLLPAQGFDPLRGKEYLRAHGVLEDQYLEVHPLSTAHGITSRDRNDVRTADVVLANFLGATRVSIGTMIEFGWADAFRVPVVAVMEPENVHRHAMAVEIAGWITESLDDGIGIARTVLAI